MQQIKALVLLVLLTLNVFSDDSVLTATAFNSPYGTYYKLPFENPQKIWSVNYIQTDETVFAIYVEKDDSYGSDIYISKSDDLINWLPPQRIFQAHLFTDEFNNIVYIDSLDKLLLICQELNRGNRFQKERRDKSSTLSQDEITLKHMAYWGYLGTYGQRWNKLSYSSKKMQSFSDRIIKRPHHRFSNPNSEIYTLKSSDQLQYVLHNKKTNQQYSTTILSGGSDFVVLDKDKNAFIAYDNKRNPDFYEYSNGPGLIKINLDSLVRDSDNDGLTNDLERYYGLDPESSDSDSDGVNDSMDLNPMVSNLVSLTARDSVRQVVFDDFMEGFSLYPKKVVNVNLGKERQWFYNHKCRVLCNSKLNINNLNIEIKGMSNEFAIIEVSTSSPLLHGGGQTIRIERDVNGQWFLKEVMSSWIE